MAIRKVREDPATRRMIDQLGEPYQLGVRGANDTINERRDQAAIELMVGDGLIDELLKEDPNADNCVGLYTFLRGYTDTMRDFFGAMT